MDLEAGGATFGRIAGAVGRQLKQGVRFRLQGATLGAEGSLKAAVACVWFAVGAVFFASSAHAQSCHLPELRRTDEVQFRVAAQSVFASYRNAAYAGEYQGYGPVASFNHPWFAIAASVYGYRIVRNGLRDQGIGDVMFDLRGTLHRSDDLALGLELGTSIPTGDPNLGLGMGHVMLMPAGWLQLGSNTFQLLVELGYGRRLGGGGHAHHASTGPIVNPMNASELEHSVTLSYVFHDPMFVGARLYGAIPVVATGGQPREAVALALGATLGRFELGAELHTAYVGTPFQAKALLRAAVDF